MLRRPALPTSAPKLRIPSWLFRSVAGGRLRRGRLGDSSLIGPMASEMDASSFDELAAEAPERPPSLEQLKQLTGGRFTQRWLKYMYNRFKNECPSGRMRFAEFKRLFGGFIPDRINDVYLERMFHAFCQNSANLEQLTFRDLVICLSRLCDERPASNAEWTMRLIGRDRGGQISPQEFHEYCKSVFLLRGKGEQNEQKKRAGSLLLGGGGSPISGRLEQQTHQPQQQQQPQLSRPPTIRSAALLASAITTPTAAPAIANFVPFVGSQQKRGPASPEQELARAIRRRSSILFKELDADQKGYLTTSDFERFFRTWDQKPLIYTAG